MGQDPEELRGEIAGTRANLSETLDAIGDRVSPGRMIERKKNRFTQGTRSVKDRVMGSVSDAGHALSGSAHGAVDTVQGLPDAARQQGQGSPMIAGAVAFGVGFLVAAALPASRAERTATASLMDKAGPLKEEMGKMAHEVVDNLKEPAQQAVAQVKEAASDAASSVTETAKGTAHDTADHAHDKMQQIKQA